MRRHSFLPEFLGCCDGEEHVGNREDAQDDLCVGGPNGYDRGGGGRLPQIEGIIDDALLILGTI
jgi:hypothetical protein